MASEHAVGAGDMNGNVFQIQPVRQHFGLEECVQPLSLEVVSGCGVSLTRPGPVC